MDKSSVFHRSFANQCYALDNDRVRISITTGRDTDKVFITYGDPFSAGIMGGNEFWHGDITEMTDVRLLEHHKVWSVVIAPKHKRLRYYFILESGGERLYYLGNGFFTEDELSRKSFPEYFVMPWINPSDVFETPKWAEDTIWYQIFPERFCNGNDSISPPNRKKWRSERISRGGFYGGDLYGIIEKIPYLKDLGITGIYMTPVFKSSSDHKYNTENYLEIDPHFGDEETFIRLVELAHKNGIRIMIDAVFNHSGWDFPFWQDVYKNGESSKYRDWYMVNKFPITKHGDTRDNCFYSFAFIKGMPKLNTNNPEVVQYFTDICTKWVRDWKIDGIRFDVANEVSHTFLKKLRASLREINSELYLVGEIWHDSVQWLLGDEFDAVMNYPLTFGIKDFFLNKELNSEYLEYHINNKFTMYPEQANRVMLNLYDSHDTIRLITSINNNTDIFIQMLAVLFTLQGSPCIYYGTEIALEGDCDPECRRCMPWDEIENGKYSQTIEAVKSLILLRKNEAATKSSDIRFIHSGSKRLVQYIKNSKDEKLLVALNCGDTSKIIDVDGKILFSNLYENGILLPDGVLICKCN